MASFGSIFKKIVGVGRAVAPIAAAFIPGAGPIAVKIFDLFGSLQSNIIAVEQNNPHAGAGRLKREAVIAQFEAGLETTNSILAIRGERVEYDRARLEAAIDKQVAAYNELRDLQESFKIVKIEEPPQA